MFEQLGEKFQGAFKHLRGQSKITEKNIEEAAEQVRKALLEADVNFKVVKNFIASVKEKAQGEAVLQGVNPEQQFIKIVQDELTAIMGGESNGLDMTQDPQIILVVGLNGAGKTTFCGKLAYHLQKKHQRDCYLVPADNFRPKAKEQLLTHAQRLKLDYFDSNLEDTPAQIVSQALKKAQELGKKHVIIDTAGRMHIDTQLMGELEAVRKQIANPEVLLVADAMTGQEAVQVAQSFHEKIGLTGAVLSKMDSDARGGAALSIRAVTQVPIKFISTGEKLEDCSVFHPERIAGRILDMGDVVTLVEKAQEVVDEKDAEKLMSRVEKDQFSMEDYLKQLGMLKKMGSMKSLLQFIPGMGQAMKQMGDLGEAESEIKRTQVLIESMTPQERRDHTLLKIKSRKERIARGAGASVGELESFYKKFLQMKQMMRGMATMMKGGGMPSLDPQQMQKNFQKKKKGGGKGPWGRKFF